MHPLIAAGGENTAATLFLLGWIVFSFIAGAIARKKGNSFAGAFLVSFFLSLIICFVIGVAIESMNLGIGLYLIAFFIGPVIGVVIALVRRPNEVAIERQRLATGALVKCPFCAELIKKEARVCRYCGREINTSDVARRTEMVEEFNRVMTESRSEGGSLSRGRIGFKFAAVAIIVALVVVVVWLVIRASETNTSRIAETTENATQGRNVLATQTPYPVVDSPATVQTTAPASDIVVLAQPVIVQTMNGSTTLPVGTELELVSREGNNLHIRYAGRELLIPSTAAK